MNLQAELSVIAVCVIVITIVQVKPLIRQFVNFIVRMKRHRESMK
jgi:hypothetical protein